MRFGIRAWGWWGGHAQSEENTSPQPFKPRVETSAGWYEVARNLAMRLPATTASPFCDLPRMHLAIVDCGKTEDNGVGHVRAVPAATSAVKGRAVAALLTVH